VAFDYTINWPFHYLFMGFFAVLGVTLLILDRRRRGALARSARELGLEFMRNEDEATSFLRGRFDFFRIEAVTSVSTVFRGEFRGRTCVAFNYWFQSQDTVRSFRHGYLCIIVPSDRELPSMRLVPKSLQDELDIQEQALEAFVPPEAAGDWRVFGRNGRAVQRMLTDEALAVPRRYPGCVLETGSAGTLWVKVGELRPENMAADLEEATALARLLESEARRGSA